MVPVRGFPLGVTSCEREGSQEVRSMKFCCSKQGVKMCPRKKDKTFTKRSRMCNYKARAIFYIKPKGEWVCKKHEMFIIMNCFWKMRCIS